ncbi:TetR family transcriptional regulator [Sphaerisporangium melleum]|uniref:TetR family transcriptional regulator n=1 Tax=Sphaerisporangium melleum TaxID=321316 RepID=A0A917VED2_9ACTN|nr:TetR family transcriptional regulator [Sphaerisporangium melleum]GGK68778.1 TetR family transcriptional regulator [Sphaerisporangium melleum]GII68932.1 TetR family transcriptional regulator [Sphaerisporangium melleum]
MSSPAHTEQRHLGLRERKKAKTRRTIQEHALRLFTEQGYENTTVEQIAEAAEISPSTFFRYFPTKEDTVIQDEYDPMIAEAFLAQPATLTPLAAMRAAVRQVFGRIMPQDEQTILQRSRLIWSIPSLRARQVDGQVAAMTMLREVMTQRTGRSPDDFHLRVLAGAIAGAWIAAIETWIESDGEESLADLMDRVLVLLEEGLPL